VGDDGKGAPPRDLLFDRHGELDKAGK
jgi:hypothetical protein